MAHWGWGKKKIGGWCNVATAATVNSREPTDTQLLGRTATNVNSREPNTTVTTQLLGGATVATLPSGATRPTANTLIVNSLASACATWASASLTANAV